MDPEAAEIINYSIKRLQGELPFDPTNNAFVYKELRASDGTFGVGPKKPWICILMQDGGWLAFPAERAIGDLAPFAG